MQIIDILLTQLCFMCSEYQLIQRHNYRRAQSQWELTLNPRWRRPQMYCATLVHDTRICTVLEAY